MFIIVDGYNVLKQAKGPQATEKEKESLIKRISQYAQAKKHEIIIVFDGGYLLYPTRESNGAVTIAYAGMYQSADDYIKRLLEKEKGKDVLLATSDNELCSFADQRGLPSIDALAFFGLIQSKKEERVVSSSTELKKFDSSPKNEELDKLMLEETGNIPLKNEVTTIRGRNKQKISNHEKKLLKKIKKL